MAAEYDDLDDLLDDDDLQAKILAKSFHQETGANGESSLEVAPGVDKPPSRAVDSTQVESKLNKLDLNSKAVSPGSQKTQSESLGPEVSKSSSAANAESAELPSGLENLLKGLENNNEAEAEAALKALLMGMSGGSEFAAGTTGAGSELNGKAGGEEPVNFEDTISATMDRLSKSQKRDQKKTDANMMEQLLNDMQNDPSGGGLEGMLSSLMGELSSKEVLYEPIKELNTNYPDWMKKNKDKLSEEELARYTKQEKIVASLIAKFEDPKYSDSNSKDRDYISEKMLEMQETGAPPDELVGGVANGAFPGMGSDNFPPELPSDCATQ